MDVTSTVTPFEYFDASTTYYSATYTVGASDASHTADISINVSDGTQGNVIAGTSTVQRFEMVLQALRGKATVLFATHQMSLIVLADILMVLDKGVIRALGKPQDLLQRPVQPVGTGAA